MASPALVHTMQMQNTKAGNALIRQRLSKWISGEIPGVDVASQADKLKGIHVNVPIQVSVAPGAFLPVGFDISAQDERLLNTAASIMEQTGVDKFTLRQLINISRGRTDNPTVEPKTQEDAMQRLTALTVLPVFLDTKDHRAYNAQKVSKSHLLRDGYQAPLFPAEFLHKDGETYIHMFAMPPLNAYASEARQMVSIPQDVLDLTNVYTKNDAGEIISSKKTSIRKMTTQILDIEQFILKQVHRIRQQHGHKPGARGYVLYSSIYDYLEMGASTFNRSKKSSKQRVDGNIEQVCDVLIQKSIIHAYNVEGKGRTRKYRLAITLE